MKKTVVAAVAAALSFAACEEARPTPVVARPMVVARTTPVIPSVIDSGVRLTRVEPAVVVDALAVAHEAPSVDHLARARQLAGEQDFTGALTEARRSLFTSPGDVDTLELIASLGRKARQPQLSAEAYQRLSALRPADAVITIKLVRARLHAKDFSGAIEAGTEAIRRDPGNPEAFQVTGLAQLASGALAPAIVSFKTVVGLQPDHGYAMNNLGLAYLRTNQNELAVEILEEAVEHLPTVAYVQNNLGVAYERVGREDDAKHAYQSAMDLSPKYVKAKINAARIARTTIEADGEEPTEGHALPEPAPTP